MRRILSLFLVLLFVSIIFLAIIIRDYLASDIPKNEAENQIVQDVVQKYDGFLDVCKEKVSSLEGNLRDTETRNQVCKFMNDDLQEDLNDAIGNISMEKFKERVRVVIKYDPSLEDLLDTNVYRYSTNQEIRQKVDELTDENSYKNTVENIQEWVENNIKYVNDYRWYTAEETWGGKEANCNGISFLTCSMMREVGIPCKVVANTKHAWTEYLYIDADGRMIWSAWDQGNSGYSVLNSNVYEKNL